MTLPEINNNMDNSERSTNKDIGAVVKDVLLQSQKEGRLTCGVFACVKLLHSNPDNVSLCVLPNVNPHLDVTVDIQHKLIEAYCWENDISVLKVDSKQKLEALFETKSENDNFACTSSDFTCLLVETSPTALSKTKEEYITEFCDGVINNNVYPRPVIDLPV